MTDSVAVFPPGFRVLDTQGNPVSGAQIRFFDAGTSNPRNVYSDSDLLNSLGSIVYTRSDGYPVASSGSSTTVTVFAGVGRYKVDILDQFGATIYPAKDNQQGAVATTNLGTPQVSIPASTQTGAVSIDATWNSKLFVANTSGGNVTATLATAVALGNGFNVEFVKNSAANTLTIACSGGNTINGQSSIILNDQFDWVSIGCDGASFYVRGSRVKSAGRSIGDIRLASVAGAQSGELECNGQAVSRTTFAALFAKIGIQHGQGDGSTTFNVPKYSGRFLRFWDHAAGVDPNSGIRTAPATGGNTGDNPGTHQADALKDHTHPIADSNQGTSFAGSTKLLTNPNGSLISPAASNPTGSPSTGAAAETRAINVYVAAYILASLPF